MAKATAQRDATALIEACLGELVQQLAEIYAIATAGEVLLSDDKGPAFHLFMTIQRLTVDRKLTGRMEEELLRLEGALP